MKRTTRDSLSILQYVGVSILLLGVSVTFVVSIFSAPKDTLAQTSNDFAFLNEMGLPWRCEEQEPRGVSQAWNSHWVNYPNGGAAIDFPVSVNTDVLAPFGGTVTETSDVWSYGKNVIIDAGNGWSVRLAHLNNILVNDNDPIEKGQVVGHSGNTTGGCGEDCSTGPHIHLELYWNNGKPDPNWFNTSGNFLFSHPTENFLPDQNIDLYSNTCGTGPNTSLFWDTEYSDLSVHFFGSGRFNVPLWFSDQASSLILPPGWSATLYEHSTFEDNWPGGLRTFAEDDPDFSDDQFDNGLVVNNKVSSLLVFPSFSCPNTLIGQSELVNSSEVCTTPIPPPPTPAPEVPTPTPPPPPPEGWQVTYYSNNDLTSECGFKVEPTGTYVFRDSGPNPSHWQPPAGCPSTTGEWSARFERDFDFDGTYEFGLFYDDGARIWVDGDLVVDGFAPSTQHYESRELHGTHHVTVEYYNNAGDAVVQAWWRGPGYLPFDPNPDPNQWFVNYWGNQRMWQDAVGKQNEGTGLIDHGNWGESGPGFGIPKEHHSAKFERTIYFECGTYRFYLYHDDGARLWVDDVLIVNEWEDGWWTTDVVHSMSEGNHDLRIDYYQNTGGAGLYFDYQDKIADCLPDLATDAVPGTSDPVIISSNPGTHVNDTLTAGEPVYIDLAYKNIDDGNSAAHFVDIYIDGALYQREWIPELNGNTSKTFEDLEIVYDHPGEHTVRLVLDPENAVVESNESNNMWEGQFYWEAGSAITDWQGEYYNNETLSGSPVVVRNDVDINFEWADGSPDPAINPDHFSARWTRTLPFQAGNYQFHVFHDDGARLWVDDVLVIDQWVWGRETHSSAPITLSAGDHDVRLEMYEIDGWAAAKLSWGQVGGSSCPTITEWKGEYYNNEDLTGTPALCRNDADINFEWVDGSPDPAISPDHFSARWTRTLPFDAGNYQFHVFHDDGARLWVDNVLVIDQWVWGRETHSSGPITLSAGDHDVRLEMFEIDGWAAAELWWEQANASCPTITEWKGEYYNNEDLAGTPTLCRNDVDINFTWDLNSPHPAINPDHFSARWTRTLPFDAGDYQFEVFHDDGARLWVDDVLVIDQWVWGGAGHVSDPITLSAGDHDVRLEMFEIDGSAAANLSWSSVDGIGVAEPPLSAASTATPASDPTPANTSTPAPPTSTPLPTATPTPTPTPTLKPPPPPPIVTPTTSSSSSSQGIYLPIIFKN